MTTAEKRRVVLVTGCSSGLGRALCEELAALGGPSSTSAYRVFATARKLESIKDLKAKGVETLQLDVCDQASVTACVEAVLREAGRVDILIANAGIMAVMPLLEQPIEQMQRSLNTNLLGVMRVVQAVTPGMMERRSGTIVCIGSVSGFLTAPFSGIYGGSKAAVHMLMDTLRMELAPWNIRVLTVSPGAFKSNIAANGEADIDLPPGSLYESIKSTITKRLYMSQTVKSGVTANEAARQVVASFHDGSPPYGLLVGGSAAYYKFMGSLAYLLPGVVSKKLVSMFDLGTL